MKDFRFSYREKDGGVQIILSYKDGAGKWRQKSRQGFPTKAAAKKAKDGLIAAAKKELATPRGAELSLADFFALHYLPARRADISEGTAISYSDTITAAKILKSMPLRDITPADITKQLTQWESTCKRSSAAQWLVVIKTILKYAVFPCGFLPDSPAAHIKQPRPQRQAKAVRALTGEQLEAVLSALRARSITAYTIAAIGAFCGLRYGEIAGLRWEDVSPDFSTLSIRRQTPSRARDGIPRPLKTSNSYREVPIPSRLADILKAYRAQMRGEALFPPSVISYQRYKTLLASLLPRGYGSHCFRHTFAVRMLSNGADIQTVAALMGDTPKTVMEKYLSFTDDLRRAAAALVEKASK